MSKFCLYFSGSCIPISIRSSLSSLYLHWRRPFEITTLVDLNVIAMFLRELEYLKCDIVNRFSISLIYSATRLVVP